MTDSTTPKATPNDAGCWIDGHRGHYAMPYLLELASGYGWIDGGTPPVWVNDEMTDDLDIIVDACDDAEAYLNEYVAPDGYSFGWHDGEFFLWADEEWEEV